MPHDVPTGSYGACSGRGTRWPCSTGLCTYLYDPRQEPLTYYHRTGPVGAMFHELRTRKGGTEATADVAMIGLGTGSVSCYAGPRPAAHLLRDRPGRQAAGGRHPRRVLHLRQGRPSGGGPLLDFRMGDARLKLKDDTGDRQEVRPAAGRCVQLRLDPGPPADQARQSSCTCDRLTPDGILALHISNKYIRLEPVAGQVIAAAAGAWPPGCGTTTAEGRPGKTASRLGGPGPDGGGPGQRWPSPGGRPGRRPRRRPRTRRSTTCWPSSASTPRPGTSLLKEYSRCRTRSSAGRRPGGDQGGWRRRHPEHGAGESGAGRGRQPEGPVRRRRWPRSTPACGTPKYGRPDPWCNRGGRGQRRRGPVAIPAGGSATSATSTWTPTNSSPP